MALVAKRRATNSLKSSQRKKLKTSSSSLPSLPEDLITEILLRLPVKSLLRFKAVCPQWNTIIASSSFIHNHSHMGSNFMSNVVHWQDLKDEDGHDVEDDLCSIFPDGALDSYRIPYPCSFHNILHGACNGILCISASAHTIALWNPATRKVRPIPSCPYNVSQLPGVSYDVGIGEDPTTGDLKIVLFYTDSNNQCQVSVYNSRTDSWKLIDEGARLSESKVVPNLGRTFSNVVLYWVIFHKITRKTSILAFDMRNDLFEEIATSDMYKYKKEDVEPTLDFIDDNLALLMCNKAVDPRRIDIWVTANKAGCWTKHANVLMPFDSVTEFGMWTRNQIYAHAIKEDKKELVVYDLDSGNTQSAGTVTEDSPYICRYKESLVQLEGNGIREFDTRFWEYQEFYFIQEPN